LFAALSRALGKPTDATTSTPDPKALGDLIAAFYRTVHDTQAADLTSAQLEAVIALIGADQQQSDARSVVRILSQDQLQSVLSGPVLSSFVEHGPDLSSANQAIWRFGLDYASQTTPYLVKTGTRPDGTPTYVPKDALYYVSTPLTDAVLAPVGIPIDPNILTRAAQQQTAKDAGQDR
jgi:hypothetical protein